MNLNDQVAHPVDAHVEEKKSQALALRIAGNSYRKIGAAIGLSHTRAHELVIDALRELRIQNAERTAELRALENARLDDLWWKLYPKPPRPGAQTPALTPDVARQLLRVSQSRRELNGLNLPQFIGGQGGDDGAFSEAVDLTKLALEDLVTLERITLTAKGHAVERFGLDPSDEIFDPTPGPDEAPSLLPPPAE